MTVEAGPVGLLLAAGAGRRMGGPKALLRDDVGAPFVARSIGVLLDGGCGSVLVVTGAASREVARLLDDLGWTDDPMVDVVVAEGWDEGMGASLRAGLGAATQRDATCVVISLVDLPDVGPEVVQRLLRAVDPDRHSLARAAYDGLPGHPVVVGRDHWPGIIAAATGDQGARAYLLQHPPHLVECGDLATGHDLDTP